MACRDCEPTWGETPQGGRLWLAFPGEHVAQRLTSRLAEAGLPVSWQDQRLASLVLSRADLDTAASCFADRAAQLELDHCMALLLPLDEQLKPAHLAQVQPLSRLLSRVEARWLVELLQAERLTTLFQPIVAASQPQQVFAYECLSRGLDSDGQLIAPGPLFDLARRADLLFELDRACRIAAIRNAHGYGVNQRLFVNFNPSSVYDPRYCLRTTLAVIRECGLTPEQVVFEVVESDHIADLPHLLEILEHYRRHGFGVALDDLGAGYASLGLLTRLRPDYVKFDMELVRGIDTDPFKATLLESLLIAAGRMGIKTIAEGIETLGEWRWLEHHGADYVQGYLFARPQQSPPQPALIG